MSEDRRLHVRDVLDIAAKENVPRAHPPAAEKKSQCFADPSEEFASIKFLPSVKISSTEEQTGFAQE